MSRLIAQYERVSIIKRDVNVRRYNNIDLRRRLRLASFIPHIRLVKGFHNTIKVKS